MNWVLQLKRRSHSISIAGPHSSHGFAFLSLPFSLKRGADVEQEDMLLTSERVENSRVYLTTRGESENMKNVLPFRSPLPTHREQAFDLEYTSEGLHYATVHPPATCPCGLHMRFWLYGQSRRREARARKETESVP